ncbi:MAG: transketolase [Actinomycetota bacterium]
MIDKNIIKNLEKKSKELRKLIVETAGLAPAAHVPSALSAADLVAALYFHIMEYDPQNPKWEGRDRFILSAGHKALVQYVALTLKGVISKEKLDTFECHNSSLGGHPCHKTCEGVEVSTGSLGHGLSIASGMAYAAKSENKNYRIFVILGDGECNEGSVWEAAMSASLFKQDNIVAIVDYNKNSVAYPISMPMEPFIDKWKSFGWACTEIDGHNMEQIVTTLEKVPFEKGKPSAIVANTIKGKGVPFAENNPKWHSSNWNKEIIQKALQEIETTYQ